MKRLIIILIILCINILNLRSQTLQELEEYAVQSYKNENYNESYKLYQRILFFKEIKTSKDYFLLAKCKNQLNEFDEAIYYYNLAINQEINDSIKVDYYLNKCRILISNKKYNKSIQNLLVAKEIATKKQLKTINFFLGSAYFLTDNFYKSKLCFNKIISDENELENLYQITSKKYPNPKKAYWLSTFFPGMGQFYLGNFKDGINSLALNASLTYLFIYSSYESSLLSSGLSIYPWLHKYITGGAANAEKNAINKREKRNKKILSKIITLYEE